MDCPDCLCLQDSSSPTEQRRVLGFMFSIRDLLRPKEPNNISPGLRWEDGVSEVGEVKMAALHRKEMDASRSRSLPGHQSPLLCDWLHDSIHDRDNSPMMRAVLRRPVCKVYRFQTEGGGWVLVREQMSESSLSFSLPKQLLALYIQEDTRRVQELEDLGDLSPYWEGLRSDVIAHHSQLITCYQDTLTQLNTHTSSSPSFKPSVSKTDRQLAFVPVNLHTQRMKVSCARTPEEGPGCPAPGPPAGVWYEVVTLGAPADHLQGFRHGGLDRLLHRLDSDRRSVGGSVFFSAEDVSMSRELWSSVVRLQPLISGPAEQLLQASLELHSKHLQSALDSLGDGTEQLVHALQSELVRSALLAAHAATPAYLADGHAPADGTAHSPSANKEAPQLWGSAHQEREFDEEEWDRVLANIGMSLNCIIAMVDRLLGREARTQEVTSEQRWSAGDRNSHSTGWQEQLLPLVVTLRECVEEAVQRTRSAVSFVLLQGALCSAAPGPQLAHRRDAVFSQALAALVSGLVLRIHAGLEDKEFLHQLHLLGVLAQFEGLLSTYGDEEGMMEDMEVGVADLSSVYFTITQAVTSDPSDLQPCLTGQRGSITVQVPLPPDTFSTLPWELKDGRLLRVHPLLFNIGINQQQSLSERFGDSSHQERINKRSCEMLKVYYNTLRQRLPCVGDQGQPGVDQLLVSLETSLGSRRRKNVEVLWLAATICRRLKGVRVTSCKSGKDRTSMSVTLEQCVLLRDQHSVSKEHFHRALDSMRSARQGWGLLAVGSELCGVCGAGRGSAAPPAWRLYPPALLLVTSHLLVVWLILSLVLLAKTQEGCRMENVQKNIGSRKYAFNSVQLLTFPKLYRPPDGTYGKAES